VVDVCLSDQPEERELFSRQLRHVGDVSRVFG
jgi:hypothetical protein